MELSAYSQDGSVTLYFVTSNDVNSEQCTKLLIYAYQACKEHDLDPQWIKTEECLKTNPTKQDVFVCDPFEGEAFNFLTSNNLKCVRVLGPRCLLNCLHSKTPVPELPSPLHNMAMHNVVVTATGFEKEEKTEIQQLIEKMCGIYSNSYHEGITHLVAKAVGTKKYLVAVQKEIPIMTEEWVRSVWRAANDETSEQVVATQTQFNKFTCPVFRGLVICVSQLPRKEKDALKALIEKNGGIYKPILEMSITSVLITTAPEGDKFKHASQWRIPCLSQDWIRDSVENGFALPMDEYKMVKKPKSSTPTNDTSVLKDPPDMSICSTIMNESTLKGASNVNETADLSDQSIFLKKQIDSKVSAGLASLEAFDLANVCRSSLFLDGCKIFASGFESGAAEKLRRILNSGGATRFNALNEGLTHVVVAKETPEILNTIHSWSVKPLIVTADWLLECMKKGKPADENKFLCFNETSPEASRESNGWSTTLQVSDNQGRISLGNDTVNGDDKTVIDEDLIQQYLNKDAQPHRRSSVNGKANLAQNNSVDCSALPDSQMSSIPDLFRNLTFTVSGYSEETEESMHELICENGGTVVDRNSTATVNYSIVSVEGEGFYAPNAQNYVTHVYIEDCFEQESLLPVQYFHLPLVWPEDAEILSDCVVAVSAYSGKERQVVINMATRMGAEYQELFARKDNLAKNIRGSTHLICPAPEGSKYGAAQKWGVHAVTKDWIIKCAQEGKRTPESPFDVRSPAEVDCKTVLISLLLKEGKLPESCPWFQEMKENQCWKGVTPINKVVKKLRVVDPSSVVTPDLETMRKMYPTPGNEPKNDSLDAMPTPDTPYGSTWSANPSSRVRKSFKRALDAMPDDKPKQQSPDTPMEVLYQRFSQKLKDMNGGYQPLKMSTSSSPELKKMKPNTEEVGEDPKEPPKAADCGRPLAGVVVYTSRKIQSEQQEIYQTVSSLGGDYKWSYDSTVTHFIHRGRVNDTNKEFRMAKSNNIKVVSPEWVWMCRDEHVLVDESLFPHHHDPKLSLSIVSTRSTPMRRRGRSKKEKDQIEETEHIMPEVHESTSKVEEDSLAKQLEELENMANVNGRALKTTPSLTSRSKSIRSSPSKPPLSTQANTETESQGTAIMWDDPKDREARARLGVQLDGNTQDIIAAQREATEKLSYVFALSGFSDDDRQMYSDAIESLGASLVDVKNVDPSITHVVAAVPNRTAKLLGAIASGKWILKPSFLNASVEEKRFVEEEEHEWGNLRDSSPDRFEEGSTESLLAAAAYRWRLSVARSNVGPFKSMRVALYSNSKRADIFVRLIEAGGGQVIGDPDSNLDEVTHCFIEPGLHSKVDLALFAARDIPCLPVHYLNDLIIKDPPPDAAESCISEYKDIVVNMTAYEQNLLKVKRN